MFRFHHQAVFSLMNLCYVVLARNISTKGIASQSSTERKHEPEKAIDQAINGYYTWSKTLREYNPWWKLDFRDIIHVYEVGIVNEASCCSKSIKDVVFPHSISALARVIINTCDTREQHAA